VTRCVISPKALDDLDEIDAYIAENNPAAADRVVDSLFEAFDTLAGSPGLGHGRQDLTKLDLRFWTVRRRHTVVYRELKTGIEIVRVFGAGRDVSARLGE